MSGLAQPPLVPLPLGEPPIVKALGVGVQGIGRRFERWLLPDLYSLHLYDYQGALTVDGVSYEIRPGCVSLVPAGSVMEYRLSGVSEHFYAHLAMPTAGEVHHVSIMRDMGAQSSEILERLREASTYQNMVHRSAEVWALLWKIAGSGPVQGDEGKHPAVQAAIRYVESQLGRAMTVADIAREVNFSPSHLDRLFRSEMGCSLSSFIKERRMSVALHLLQHSTRPISSIAASVGMPDLHAFNKACRRYLRASPRALRGAKER